MNGHGMHGKKLTRAWEPSGCVSLADSEHAFMSDCVWWMYLYLHTMLLGHEAAQPRIPGPRKKHPVLA